MACRRCGALLLPRPRCLRRRVVGRRRVEARGGGPGAPARPAACLRALCVSRAPRPFVASVRPPPPVQVPSASRRGGLKTPGGVVRAPALGSGRRGPAGRGGGVGVERVWESARRGGPPGAPPRHSCSSLRPSALPTPPARVLSPPPRVGAPRASTRLAAAAAGKGGTRPAVAAVVRGREAPVPVGRWGPPRAPAGSVLPSRAPARSPAGRGAGRGGSPNPLRSNLSDPSESRCRLFLSLAGPRRAPPAPCGRAGRCRASVVGPLARPVRKEKHALARTTLSGGSLGSCVDEERS